MVDTRKMRNYIKLADCTENEQIVFTEEGELIEKEFENQSTKEKTTRILWQTKARLSGQDPKEISLSESHVAELKKAWGHDTASWINKICVVKFETRMIWGERKKLPFLEPSSEQTTWDNTPTPQPAAAQEPPASQEPPEQPTTDGEKAWDEEEN